jgi:D-2-hydroxyacid dehydrogenase (NADP+)
MNKPKILLSDVSARELSEKIDAILGREAWMRLTAQEVHQRGVSADLAFVSRDVTGSSTKQQITPETQFYYDALMLSKDLKWVQIHSSGADRQIYVDLVAKDVTVTTAAGASAGMVAQTALAGLMSLARRFPQLARAQSAHEWAPFIKTGLPPELEGQTATIVGWGPIGQKLGAWLMAIGLKIIVVRQSSDSLVPGARVVSFKEFHNILPISDWMILVCPLTAQTNNLISAQALDKMKSGSHIINVSRGAVVDEPAMIAALKRGHLAGAFLDVFAQEPLPKDSELWDMPNVIATPHTAAFSDGILPRMSQMFLDNLERWKRGEALLNVVKKQ